MNLRYFTILKYANLLLTQMASGIIVVIIFKLIKKLASAVAKPFAKKAIKSGLEKPGKKLRQKTAGKSGDLIMKRLGNTRQGNTKPTTSTLQKPTVSQPEESTDMRVNRLISGQGKTQNQGGGLLLGKNNPFIKIPLARAIL